jgi:hypothetical protein
MNDPNWPCRCSHQLRRHGGVVGLCWYPLKNKIPLEYCSCDKYISDNLRYLEQKYEEKIYG